MRRRAAIRRRKLIPIVESVTAEIEAMAGAAESELSRGGMRTKIEAAKIATTAGTHMLIASGKIEHPLQAIADGGRCTWFLTPANPVTARKRWIAGSLEPKGTLTIDAGAVSALRAGKSLLPAGVIRVDGQFARGDAVVVRGPDTHEIGRGLVAYDAEDADKIKGRSSPDVMAILGISGRAEMIHRDDLVVGPSGAYSAELGQWPSRPAGRKPPIRPPPASHAAPAPRKTSISVLGHGLNGSMEPR